jgi:hypothetical protein
MGFIGQHSLAARRVTSLATVTWGAVLIVAVVVALVAAGCSDAADGGPTNSNLVTSHLALSLPTGANIASVGYRVLSSEDVTLAAGTIDVSQSGASLSLDLILAPGSGDVIELSAVTSAGATCAGTSAPFDVTPGQPVFVGLTLICGGDQPDTGHCPTVQSWGVTPVVASVPLGTIDVGVTAGAPDATDPLTTSWIATAGSFVDASAAETQYVCTTAGPQTLALTVRDDASSPACAATATFLVSCVSSGDLGSPTPSVVSVQAPDRR